MEDNPRADKEGKTSSALAPNLIMYACIKNTKRKRLLLTRLIAKGPLNRLPLEDSIVVVDDRDLSLIRQDFYRLYEEVGAIYFPELFQPERE